jgi:hypothetical protein
MGRPCKLSGGELTVAHPTRFERVTNCSRRIRRTPAARPAHGRFSDRGVEVNRPASDAGFRNTSSLPQLSGPCMRLD